MKRLKIIKQPFSYFIIWIILIVQLYCINDLIIKKPNKNVISWDVLEYYSYLPATFIYGDVQLRFMNDSTVNRFDKFWPKHLANNGWVLKMTMGMSILYSPFFFSAHAIAKIFHLQADGYIQPYRIALILSCLFYLTIALLVLRKMLLRWFNDAVTTLTLALIVLGTNLFYYSTLEAPMSHAYNFSLFVFFIFFCIKWHENQKWTTTILLGLSGGLIILIRPINILIWLFFLLFNVTSIYDLLFRFKLLFKQYSKLIVIAFCIFAVIFPQLLYWKAVTGHWIYYSYNDEGFFFKHPHIIQGLFSYRKGWLLYTPIMTLALIGIPFLYFRIKEFFLPILIFMIIFIYIVFSWWTWWYGGSFGQRAMIDSYALLAFPLATIISLIWKRKIYLKIVSVLVILLFIWLNIFQTYQCNNGTIHFDSMTKKAYWNSFGHLNPQPGYYELLETPDYEKAKKGIEDDKPKNK
jgi:hypothetical protein